MLSQNGNSGSSLLHSSQSGWHVKSHPIVVEVVVVEVVVVVVVKVVVVKLVVEGLGESDGVGEVGGIEVAVEMLVEPIITDVVTEVTKLVEATTEIVEVPTSP